MDSMQGWSRMIVRTLLAVAFVTSMFMAFRSYGADQKARLGGRTLGTPSSTLRRLKSGRATAVSNQDLGTFATNIWITLDSYIGYFENYATNNYQAARLANYRAKRLEFWQWAVSNQLLLADAPADGLKRSAYFRLKTSNLCPRSQIWHPQM